MDADLLVVALAGPALIAWWCVRYLRRLKREAGLPESTRSWKEIEAGLRRARSRRSS